MSNVYQEELMSLLAELFEAGSYSDLTITCGNEQHKVHKAIEGGDGVITLEEDDPQAVKSMIHYLYHLDYPPLSKIEHPSLEHLEDSQITFHNPLVASSKAKAKKKARSPEIEVSDEPNLTAHARVYALAEKYNIEGLKLRALEKFKKETDHHWNSEDFLRAAEEVYTSTVDRDRGMRDAVVHTIQRH